MTDVDCDVLVAGAGPVGLMLAIELALGGARVLVVERRTEPDTASKAAGINTASAEALRRRGLLAGVEAAATQRVAPERQSSVGHFGGIQVPADRVDERDPVLRGRGPAWHLPVLQVELERVLGEHADSIGVEIRRGVELADLHAHEAGVTAALQGGGDVRASWLVGCDGGRSLVRRTAGFEFPGTEPQITVRQAVGTVEGAHRLGQGWQHTSTGVYVYGPAPGRVRTVELDGPPADRDAPVTAAEMDASLRRVSGVDVHVTEVRSGTRFTDHARQATTYRRGRVLLCGDAAHVHSPFSGQGLNLGLGDAVNLGWKLAATARGRAPAGLLDSYDAERHPVGAAVLDWTRAQVAVMRGDPYSCALRAVVTDLLHTRDGATEYLKRISGLTVRYELGDEHPLVGTTIPDLQLDDRSRLFDFTRTGLPLLVDLSDGDELTDTARPYGERLQLVRGRSPAVEADGLLLRPDGVVAWAAARGAGDPTGLDGALARWVGSGAITVNRPAAA